MFDYELIETQLNQKVKVILGLIKQDYYQYMSYQKKKTLDDLIESEKVVIVNKGKSKFEDETLAHGGRTLGDGKIHFYPDVAEFKSDKNPLEECEKLLVHECFHYFIQPDELEFENQEEKEMADFYTEGLVERESREFCKKHKEILFKEANYGYNIKFVNMIQETLNADSYDIIFSEDDYLKNIGKYRGQYNNIISERKEMLNKVEELVKYFPSDMQNKIARRIKSLILRNGNIDNVIKKLKQIPDLPKDVINSFSGNNEEWQL